MKKIIFFILIFLPGKLWAADFTTVPWEEFKTLYQESIKQNILKDIKKEESPSISCLEEAVYKIKINKTDAEVQLMLSGQRITGKPQKIPLFEKDIIIDDIKQVTGGIILQDENNHIVFLPEGNDEKKDFGLQITFSVPTNEDSKSCIVSFSVPKALKNFLSLKLSQNMILVDHPGIKKADGFYHFSTSSSITIRFSDQKDVSTVAVTEIDTFSRIKVQGHQAIVTTHFLPIQPMPPTIVLQIPKDAKYISSSLKTSWVKELAKNKYQISIPNGVKEKFYMQFAYDELEQKGRFSFFLPIVQHNNGKQGCFIVEQPDDGEIILNSENLVSDIPVATLNTKLVDAIGTESSFMKIPPMQYISLRLTRFETMHTPSIVLDSISFFTSFDDNGSILSVLIMDIPPEAGPRISLDALPETDIWYLKVNGIIKKVYGNQRSEKDDNLNQKWIIPLAKGESSHIELAYFRQSKKLGLYGKLETLLPEIGLPSRSVQVGIALPKRIQLLSLEGPVSPAQETAWETPKEFIGKPYYFSRAFDKGEGMKITLSYKEPANQGE